MDNVQRHTVSYNEDGNSSRMWSSDSGVGGRGGASDAGGLAAVVQKQADQIDRMSKKVRRINWCVSQSPLCVCGNDLITESLSQINTMADAQEQLQGQLKLSQMVLFVLLALAVLTFLLLFWRTYNLGSICSGSSAAGPQGAASAPPFKSPKEL